MRSCSTVARPTYGPPALGNGEAMEVANSCIDYIDPCSGMLGNDLDAWVRRPALFYAVSAGKLELLKVLLGSHL